MRVKTIHHAAYGSGMSAAGELHTLELFGTVVGTLGVCIALYLQFVHPHRVRPHYVAGFFTFGAVLTLLHTQVYIEPQAWNLAARAVALSVAIVVEVGGFGYVLRVTERENSVREAVGDAAEDLLP